MKNISDSFIRSIPLSILIITSAYLIVYLFLQQHQKLDLVLFTFGSIPIILFLPSVFGQTKSGALHTPKVIFRKVNTLEKRNDSKNESILPALSYVFAGISTWLYGLLIY